MLLGDLDAGMTEKHRDLINGNTGQQHLNSEGIPEHVRKASLYRAVRFLQSGKLEEPPKAALPVSDSALGHPVSTPEEVTRIGPCSLGYRA